MIAAESDNFDRPVFYYRWIFRSYFGLLDGDPSSFGGFWWYKKHCYYRNKNKYELGLDSDQQFVVLFFNGK